MGQLKYPYEMICLDLLNLLEDDMNRRNQGLRFLTQPLPSVTATRSSHKDATGLANATLGVRRDAGAEAGISTGRSARLHRAYVSDAQA